MSHRPCGGLSRSAVLVSSVLLAAGARSGLGGVILTKNSSTNWTITNGQLNVVFSPSGQKLTSIKLGASSTNLISSLDQEFAGTPFGSGTQTFNSVTGPNNSYVDVWTSVASTGTTVNPITYAFHYVLFDNDPTVHVYEALSHSATDPATSVGQGQFLFRGASGTLFNTTYQQNTGPNNLVGVQAAYPSANSNFTSVSAQAGRNVQDATWDLSGSVIPGENGTNFYTKYDTSSYTQFDQGQTLFGNTFGVTAVIPSLETLTGGPTKQVLNYTNPQILNLEFMSDHYGIDAKGTNPGYAYTPPQGVDSTKLFGPYAFNITSSVGKTGAQMYNDAVSSIPTYQALYNTDTALASAGYTPTGDFTRGKVQITASNAAGWSSNNVNNTIVLSDPHVEIQETHQGNQYWAQMDQSGHATITNATAGTYRLTMYQLGQWGETRVDGVQVVAGNVSMPQSLNFTPENFGTAPPIWTIGTPDRSSHEFLNGHNASGNDQRQYYGAYDFWAEEHTLGNDGKVVYYATAVGANAATNDPNKFIANQWQTFNPPLYDSTNSTTDNYSKIAPTYVRTAANGGTGPGPASFHGSPWEIHFTLTAAQLAQGQFAVISIGSVALDASLVVSLNGHSETWGFGNYSPDDPQTRSGVAGFYQWAAFQFPIADLNAVGLDNIFTLSPSAHANGVEYDALRMEITNISANPSITGWHDYTYVNGSSVTAVDDTIGLTADNSWAAVPEPASLAIAAGTAIPLLLQRRRRGT